MEMKPYEHKTQYYETDQMRIIHHANYIKWFEEARTDYLDQMGLSYAEMEDMGIVVPVLGVSADYKSMVKYGDTVRISLQVEDYNGVKLAFSYRVEDAVTGELRTIGNSRHCFLNEDGRPMSLKRNHTEIHELFVASL